VAIPLRVGAAGILPHGAGEHDTAQVTPFPLGSLPTVAMMFGTVPIASTVAVAGVTAIVTEGTVIVTVAVFVESVNEVAVTVTVRSLAGGVAGAV